jgi:hypothetical protein
MHQFGSKDAHPLLQLVELLVDLVLDFWSAVGAETYMNVHRHL